MGQVFCTGATHFFINGGKGTVYLGTAEGAPSTNVTRNWDATMNDISGSRDPLEYLFEGEGEAVISIILTRWNMLVLQALKTFPFTAQAISNPALITTRGSNTLNDIGSGMAIEGNTYGLLVYYQFGAAFGNKAAYLANGMESGKFFPQCITWGPDRSELGTKAKKEQLIFRAYKRFVPSPVGGTFTLYTENPTLFPAIPALN